MANRVSILVEVKDRFTRGFQRAKKSFGNFSNSLSNLTGKLKGAGSSFSSFAGIARGALSSLKLGLVGVVVAIGAFIAGLVALSVRYAKSARDAVAAQRKFNTVFRDTELVASTWAEDFGNAFGLATSEVHKFAGQLGDILIPMGHTRDAAAQITKSLSGVAGAIALFDGTAPSKVFEDLVSAVTGSAEVLFKYGINVKVEALNNKLLAESLEDVNLATDDLTKSLLVAQAVVHESADAIEGLEGSLTSQNIEVLRAEATLREAKEELGKFGNRLIVWGARIVTEWVPKIESAVRSIIGFAQGVRRAFLAVTDFLRITNKQKRIMAEAAKEAEKLRKAEEERQNALKFVNEEAERLDKLVEERLNLLRREQQETKKSQAATKARIDAQRREADALREAERAKREAEQAERDYQRSIERSTDLVEDFAEAQGKATKERRSFAQQARELQEEEREALQSIPERLASELRKIQEERQQLLENTSIDRAERKRQLDDLILREEAVNRIIKGRGITQEEIARGAQRDRRPQIERDIESIVKKIGDIKMRQRELEERAEESRIKNLKDQRDILLDQLKITKEIRKEEERGIVKVRQRGLSTTSPGRSAFEGGGLAPRFGNLGLRSPRSERRI